MQEVKGCYAPVAFSFTDAAVRVHNRNLFAPTSAYRCMASIQCDGRRIRQCELPDWNVEPLGAKEFALPFEALGVDPDALQGECCLEIAFCLKEDTSWAKAGHEVAFGQKVWGKMQESHTQRPGPLTVIQGNLNVGVSGRDFSLLFSKLHGGLRSYRWQGQEMLSAVPKPNFWRAPTDNDVGNRMGARYGQWKLASLYSCFEETPAVRVEKDRVELTLLYHLATQPASDCTVRYIVSAEGKIRMTLSYTPVQGLTEMPEFGLSFQMDADFDQCTWYGMGPEETYCDRCTGAKLGVFASTTQEALSRYLRPQECGNRTGVRWAKVMRKDGTGLLFETRKPMDFSALPYTPHELENARHSFELPRAGKTVVRTALRQMGVGGDNTWGAFTHDPYLIHCQPGERMEFEVIVSALSHEEGGSQDANVSFEAPPMTILTPLDDCAMNLGKLPDEVFASGTLGNGCGIEPDEDTVYPILDWISPHWMHASKVAVKVRHCTTVISPAIACIHSTFKICLYSKAYPAFQVFWLGCPRGR